MTSLQETIIKTLHVQPKIDPATEIERRVDFLASFLKKTGMKTLVLGISGGQDSSLAGRLSQLAVEKLRQETSDQGYQFIAVRLPYGEQADESDAMMAINPHHLIRMNKLVNCHHRIRFVLIRWCGLILSRQPMHCLNH